MSPYRLGYLLLSLIAAPAVGALTDSGDIHGVVAVLAPIVVSGLVAILAELGGAAARLVYRSALAVANSRLMSVGQTPVVTPPR